MYDTIIIGGGPAGLTAGIYLGRAGLHVLIIERESIGGQMSTSPLIENYPGFSSIRGMELANNMYEQAIKCGAEIEIEDVKKIQINKKDRLITIETDSSKYECKSLIIATGGKYKKIEIPSEKKFIGKGIHFCASCDGAFFKDRIVAVIGGANSAVTNAIYLSGICKKVYLIYQRSKLRCEKALYDKILKIQNVEIIYNANVTEMYGDNKLKTIELSTGDRIDIDAVFESVGMQPQTELVDNILRLDDEDYVIAKDCLTEYPEIFVAGDCREKMLRQVSTAVGDGATAANEVIKFLK